MSTDEVVSKDAYAELAKQFVDMKAYAGSLEKKVTEGERELDYYRGYSSQANAAATDLEGRLAECEREKAKLLQEPMRVIKGCQHRKQRMIEWVNNGACPVCLSATVGIQKDQLADLSRKLGAAREALAPVWKGLMILHERLTTDWANRLDDPYELSGRLTGHDVIKLLAALTEAGEQEKR